MHRPTQPTRRRGTVLIVAMVVVFAIAAMVLTLTRQVRTQALVSTNELATAKADAAQRGAEQFVLSLLTDYRESVPGMTETEFSAVPVGDAFFWIIRPTYNDTNTQSWGLVDEASKLSLNVAADTQLMTVPGMTEELAAAIVQWRGQTDTTATATDGTAAAGSTSGTLTVTDGAKNAPFETVDELMMMPTMTRELLHGLPPAQATAAAAAGNSTDWYQTHGLFDYFTVWSQWPNTAADGTARVSYNAADQRDALNTLLAEKLGNAARASEIINIITPRTGGGRRGRPAQATPVQLTDLFDLADKANLTTEELAAIEDYVTNDSQATTVKGRLNINTAPRELLLTLPNLVATDVDTLIARRPEAVASTPNSVAWVYDAIKDKAVGLGNLICGTGRQFSADIVAASGNGRAFKHVRIVVDTTSSPARVVYRRDLTDQGWPMDTSILDQLKAGTFAGGQTPMTASATGAR